MPDYLVTLRIPADDEREAGKAAEGIADSAQCLIVSVVEDDDA